MSDGLPAILKVEEAARILRISRTSAYDLANQWLETSGQVGLPAIRLGRSLRVPRKALEEMIGSDLTIHPTAPSTDEKTARRTTATSRTRRPKVSITQPDLFDSETA